MLQTVDNLIQVKYEVKHSKFIGTICGINDRQAAVNFVKNTKLRFDNATHNVYAYILEHDNIKKCSDDNEPKGTAGLPVLNVLLNNNLANVAIVVTRYFGGILLGTSGLARAYSSVASLAVSESNLIIIKQYIHVKIDIKYHFYSIINNLLKRFNVSNMKIAFIEKIHLELDISDNDFEFFRNSILEICSGDVVIKRDDKI